MFDDPADCTPWVIGGLWPTELETVTPRTATIAEYLKNDLQRIADSANVRIHTLRHAHLGMCRICNRPAAPGRKKCAKHLAEYAIDDVARRIKSVAKGCCVRCFRPHINELDANFRQCLDCRENRNMQR